MSPHSIPQKFDSIREHWRPKVVASLNGQELKLVKVLGEFPWHHHDDIEELFLVWRGQMRVEYRDHIVVLNEGDFHVVPRGAEHRTCADAEASVLIFEPAGTRNTGNLEDPYFTAPSGVTI